MCGQPHGKTDQGTDRAGKQPLPVQTAMLVHQWIKEVMGTNG